MGENMQVVSELSTLAQVQSGRCNILQQNLPEAGGSIAAI